MGRRQRIDPPEAVLRLRSVPVWWRDPTFWGVSLLAAVLILWNLGGRCLWQDEAETALLGRSILQFGKPVASDGINVISQEVSREFGPDHVWRWSPWVQFYLGAAGLKWFGDTTLGARLPFALAGLLVVPLTWALTRIAFSQVLVARITSVLLATSVPFLLHVRQARWHAPAYVFACVILIAVLESRSSNKWPMALTVAGAGLFYTNYFVAICYLFAIAISSPLLSTDRRFLLRIATALAGAAVLSLPGVIFHHVFGKSDGAFAGAWPQFLTYLTRYVTVLAPLPVVLGAVSLAVLGAGKGSDPGIGWRRTLGFFLLLNGLTIALLSLAPWAQFRYITILLPAAMLVMGVAATWVVQRNALAGWAIVTLLVTTSVLHRMPFGASNTGKERQADARLSPLAAFGGEILRPPVDAEWVVAGYLHRNAAAGDVVVATYGDLPLQFYTRLQVVGGLQGKALPDDPNWIVARSFVISDEPGKDFSVFQFLDRFVDKSRYELVLAVPDSVIGGNPDPRFHLFTERTDEPPLRLLKRIR